jgi:hypothetical protein
VGIDEEVMLAGEKNVSKNARRFWERKLSTFPKSRLLSYARIEIVFVWSLKVTCLEGNGLEERSTQIRFGWKEYTEAIRS